MKYYRDPATDDLFAYEADGSQDAFIPAHLVPISEEEANALCAEKERALLEGRTYAEKRAAEYPPITDYVDGVVKGDAAQVQAYIDACLAVKAKYPKP